MQILMWMAQRSFDSMAAVSSSNSFLRRCNLATTYNIPHACGTPQQHILQHAPSFAFEIHQFLQYVRPTLSWTLPTSAAANPRISTHHLLQRKHGKIEWHIRRMRLLTARANNQDCSSKTSFTQALNLLRSGTGSKPGSSAPTPPANPSYVPSRRSSAPAYQSRKVRSTTSL